MSTQHRDIYPSISPDQEKIVNDHVDDIKPPVAGVSTHARDVSPLSNGSKSKWLISLGCTGKCLEGQLYSKMVQIVGSPLHCDLYWFPLLVRQWIRWIALFWYPLDALFPEHL